MSSETAKSDDTDNSPEGTCNQEPLQEDSPLNQELQKYGFSIMYQCQYCELSYVDERGMWDHLQTHSVYNVYECTNCQTSFSDVNEFIFHTRHHAVKNLKCRCGAPFQYPMNFAKHLQSHAYKTLYQCKYCSYFCHRLDALTRHLKTHPEENFQGKKECDNNISNQSNDIKVVRINPSSVRFSCEVENFSGPENPFGKGTSSSGPEISCSPATGDCSHNGRKVKHVPGIFRTSETLSSPGYVEVPEMPSTTMTISGCETEHKCGPVGDFPKDDSSLKPQSAPSSLDEH